jgi:hypothetical protein
MFKNWAAGTYDSLIYTLVQTWAAQGFTTQYWRPGWEMDLSAQPWYVTSNPQTEADYIAAFQHIYTVLHAAATQYGVTMQVVWNPSIANATGVQINTYYPGNAYVDVIGADIYDNQYPYGLYDFSTNTWDSSFAQWSANPVNLFHYWNYPADNGYVLDASNGTSVSLLNLLAFAQADGKPFAIAEAGAGGGTTSNDELDDPWFVQWLAQTLAATTEPIDFVNIWDSGSNTYSAPGSGKPLEEAAWAQYFGSGVSTLSGTVVISASGAGAVGDGGVTVSLLNGGVTQSTTVTATGGTFSFTGLIYGSYQLSYTAPKGSVLELGSLATPSTGLTGAIGLLAGQTLNVGTEALLTNPATIKGTVVNSAQGGVAVSGMTINLVNSSGTPIATTTTNSSGAFAFTDLAAGTYEVQYVPPSIGLALSSSGIANPFTGLTGAINLAAGQVDTLATEALVTATATISGTVLYTTSSATGAARAGVSVQLLNSTLQVVATQTTSSSGVFQFTGLTAGSYSVKFIAPSGTLLQAGGPANTGSGVTAVQTVTAGQVDALPAETLVPTGAEIGGQILVSVSGSGTAAVSNATVTLLNSSGSTVATTLTNSSGNFLFTALAAGSYMVAYPAASGQSFELGSEANQATGVSPVVTLATNQVVTLPVEQLLTSPASIMVSAIFKGTAYWPEIGQTVSLYNSSGGLVASSITDTSGDVTFSGVAAGSYQLGYTAPAGVTIVSGPNSLNPTTGLTSVFSVAAGANIIEGSEYVQATTAAKISGTVLYQNAAGTTVDLVNATVTLLDGSGDTLASLLTSAWGGFQFYGLAAGNYQLLYVSPSGEAPGPGGPANTATGLTGLITVGAGASVVEATETFIAAVATLGGSVTYGGTGDAGVAVALLSSSGSQLANTTTNSTGFYQFSGIVAGAYEIKFTAPANTLFGTGPANSNTGITAPVTLTAGQTTTLAAENLLPAPATISGTVVSSATGAGGVGLAGVSIALLNASGSTVATASTNSSGAFQFSGLAIGVYTVQYSAPSGTVLELGSTATASTGLSAPVTLGAGQTVNLPTEQLLTNPATITASATFKGTGYWPEVGQTISLYNSSGGLIATAVSDNSGNVSFSGLAAGSYQLGYTAPSGMTISSGPNGLNTTTGLTNLFSVGAGGNVAIGSEYVIATPAATLIGSLLYQNGQGVTTAEANATVTLLNSSGAALASILTNPWGGFQFYGLSTLNYEIAFTAPANTLFGTGPANSSTGITAPVTVTGGQATTLATETLLPAPLATLTGTVVSSASGTGGTAASGVSIALLNASGNTIATALTDSTGAFQFTGLAAGTYNVAYTAPSGTVLELGSTANANTGLSAPVTLAASQNIALPAEQLLTTPATINASADFKAAGVWPEIGQTISLYNSSGGLIATALTNSAGGVTFSGLAAGSYQLGYNAPFGMAINSGPNGLNTATGLTNLFNLAAGATVTQTTEYVSATTPATLIGSILYQNASGVTSNLANATVTLLNSSGGVLTSIVTNPWGGFQLFGLFAGTYEVSYTLPSGDSFASGPANSSTGVTSPITLVAGQTVNLAAETLQAAGILAQVNPVAQVAVAQTSPTNASSISGTVVDSAAGQTGVAISLLNASGTAIAQTTTNTAGAFSFAGLSAGTYQLDTTAVSSQPGASWTDLSQPIALGANQAATVSANQFAVASSNSFVLNGAGQKLVGGNGNFVVTGTASGSSLILGAGDQTVSLTGGADTIVVGAGGSTISALGGGNMISAGAGMNFITADGSSGNVFYVNGAGQGTTTINGFNTVGDVLDLSAALSGVAIAADMSNLGTYVTASVTAGNTTLWIDPTGGSATPAAFVVLNGISASLPQLIAAHDISLM